MLYLPIEQPAIDCVILSATKDTLVASYKCVQMRALLYLFEGPFETGQALLTLWDVKSVGMQTLKDMTSELGCSLNFFKASIQ